MPDKLTRERILEATTHRNNGCKIPVVTKFQNHPVTVTFLWQDEFRRDDAGLGPHSSSFSRIHPSRDSNVSIEEGRKAGRWAWPGSGPGRSKLCREYTSLLSLH